MADCNLFTLAKEYPGTTIAIKLADLVEANTRLVADVKRELEESLSEREATKYLSREAVMEKFNISPTTLWRWAKDGYLVPINVGGLRRYKSTDIDKILEGER